jgi:hypothetical protein
MEKLTKIINAILVAMYVISNSVRSIIVHFY